MSGPASRRRSLAVLALSAAAGPAGISDETVLALLWPEFDSARARNNLKQVTFALRAALGPNVLDRSATSLRLNPANMRVDLWAFQAALDAGDVAKANSLYRGPFLQGFHVPNLPDFERWLEEQREALTQDYVHALRTIALEAEGDRRYDDAVHSWRRLTTLEPLSEVNSLGLTRVLAAAGDTAAALQQSRAYADLLRFELDIGPSATYRAHVDQLRAAAY